MIMKTISECSKLAQKEYKTRHDWAEMAIYWELCKQLHFDHTTKWYMYKSESVLKNKTLKIIRDFKIQTDYLILSRKPDQVFANKKKETCFLVDLVVLADYRVEIKEIDKY